MAEIKDIYQQKVDEFTEKLKEAKRKHTTVSIIRLSVFLIAIIAIWQFWAAGNSPN